MNSSDRLAIVKSLQLHYDPEPFHSNHVAKLALQLFDELSALHGLSVPERLLLEAAALLHDIGYARESDGHHKNSLKMILEYGLPGFTPTEIAIVANVARYHRKSPPSADHKYYVALDPEAAAIIRKLAALLRIADGLDRSHRSLVYEIKSVIEPHKVIFQVYYYGELRNEISAAERKVDLFESEFDRQVIFRMYYINSMSTLGDKK